MLDVNRLTIREIEILRLIAIGHLNKQIAADFNISE
ncbi:MAG: LuxR C-terminal-related transcriptional regulator [Dehalococcoidia bacterium]